MFDCTGGGTNTGLLSAIEWVVTSRVAGPAVESWAGRVAAQHGFVDVSHTLEIFGTCPSCAR